MQFIQKHIVSISIVAILAIISGYFAVQKNTLSQSDIETATGEQLETVANSGTTGTIPPFSTGNSLTEGKEEKKLEFKKPNTEWKTRTLSGITYVFGKGNPKEVAINLDQIDAMTKRCRNDISLTEKGICNADSGTMNYVNPEVEKYLLLALSDPNWIKLATVCENSFRARERHLTTENIAQMLIVDINFLYFDRVFAPGFLDIERFISVDPTTGFKVLNNHLTIRLAKFVMNGMYDGALRGEPQPNPYGDCVDRYGKNIAQNLIAATNLSTHPLQQVEGLIPKESEIPFSFH